MSDLYSATVTSWGGRTGRVVSDDQRGDLALSIPKAMGGDDGRAPTPNGCSPVATPSEGLPKDGVGVYCERSQTLRASTENLGDSGRDERRAVLAAAPR